jgi:predicted O-methyltransferase YrrM
LCAVSGGTYEFTQDWVGKRTDIWSEVFQPHVGAPVRMLEVGSFEGRSTVWFLENVLTHPEARIVCVDTFAGGVEHGGLDLSELEQRFDRNMASHAQKVIKAKGLSRVVLRELPLESFDIAYVDGSHEAADVLADAVLVWDLVKAGGLVVFDDYGWEPDGPRVALDAFLQCMEGTYESLHKGYLLVLTRK